MKILGVRFKNINSLRGEWEIRLDQSPLSETGLFAIVGPNGSGKTSILDAVTLGLYGSTPRLPNGYAAARSFPEEESRAEVWFSVSDHRYMSCWIAGETTLDPGQGRMELYSLNGGKTLLEENLVSVRNRVADLTGLDFKRFCRSILLAQNQFSAFLHALENERAEILQEIVGPELVQEIRDSIRSRAEKETDRYQRIQEEIAGFSMPSRNVLEEAAISLDKAEAAFRENERNLTELRDRESNRIQMEQAPFSEKEARDALATAEANLEDIRKENQRIKQVGSVESLRNSLQAYQFHQERAEVLRGQQQEMESRYQSHLEHKDALDRRHTRIREELSHIQARLADGDAVIREAVSIQKEIAKRESLFRDTVFRLETLEREKKEIAGKDSNDRRQADILMGHISELEKWIESGGSDRDLEAVFPQMENVVHQLDSLRTNRGELLRSLEKQRKSTRQVEAGFRRVDSAWERKKARLDQIEASVKNRKIRLAESLGNESEPELKKQIDVGRKSLAMCRELHRIGRKYATISRIRQELQDVVIRKTNLENAVEKEREALQGTKGQIRFRDNVLRFTPERRDILHHDTPCPLCGSTHHPFVETGEMDFTGLNQWIREKEETMSSLEKELEPCRKRILVLHDRVQELDELERKWRDNCLNIGVSWEPGDLNSIRDYSRNIRNDIREAGSRLRSAWWMRWTTRLTERRLERKRSGFTVSSEHRNSLQEDYQTAIQKLLDLERELEESENLESSLYRELSRYMKQFHVDPLEPGKEDIVLSMYRERRDRFQGKSRELEASREELRRLQAAMQSVSVILQRLGEEIVRLSSQAENLQRDMRAFQEQYATKYQEGDPIRHREEMGNSLNMLQEEEADVMAKIQEIDRLVESDRNALNQVQKEREETCRKVEQSENELKELAVGSGFSSLHDMQNALEVFTDVPGLPKRMADVEKTITSLHEWIGIFELGKNFKDDLGQIRRKIFDEEKHRNELLQEISDGKTFLERAKQTQREYRELLQALEAQEKRMADAVAEERLLTAQGGPEQRIQRLLLERLLEESNRHWKVLSNNRYTLVRMEPGIGLEDQNSKGTSSPRGIQTLSGGESFLVSLSLALGLSDMAARNRKIETLFLDEGFGSLDEETLYRVLSALKKLRVNGKTVGIVSHVRRLAEEIPMRICLEKADDGSGRIRLVA
jgi:DNA repair exonuclease SbcCD ATPase subunit